MTDGDALLRAVLAAPEDDAPRLVYADWLDERGEGERAELIRLQVEQAQIDPCPLDGVVGAYCRIPNCRPCWLRKRVSHLLNDNAMQWAPAPSRHLTWQEQWHRGFVYSVGCPAQWWLRHGPELVAAHPVEMVRLTDKEPNHVVTISGRRSWNWYMGRAVDPANVPLVWFRLMGGTDYQPLEFPDAHQAAAALSAACLAWARDPYPVGACSPLPPPLPNQKFPRPILGRPG